MLLFERMVTFRGVVDNADSSQSPLIHHRIFSIAKVRKRFDCLLLFVSVPKQLKTPSVFLHI